MENQKDKGKNPRSICQNLGKMGGEDCGNHPLQLPGEGL